MSSAQESFRDKVVIITGASSGVGCGTAIHLAGAGARLSLTGRNEERLNKTKQACMDRGLDEKKILVTPGDLTSTENLKQLVNNTVQTFGQIDILVNNAAVLITGGLCNTTMETYDSIMNTNTRAVFELTQMAVPYIKQTKGAIVNVSSIAGPRPFPKIMAYAMAKAAMDSFTQCLAQELAPDGVRVNSVNPGTIESEMYVANGIMTEEQFSDYMERQKGVHPLGRIATVQDVAQAISFLASDQSSFITGINMLVDGGRAGFTPHLVAKK